MAYDSSIKLDLPLLPETQDPALFNAILPVYNALHLHNQYIDQYITIDNPPEEEWPQQKPEQNYPIKSVYLPVSVILAEPIVAGNVVQFVDDGVGLNALGAGGVTTPLALGIALSDGAPGDYIRIAMGPGIIQVEGIMPGVYYTASGPSLALLGAGTGILLTIGFGVSVNRLYFNPAVIYKAPEDTGGGG